VRWVCIGAAAELIAVSALWSWLPSFLNRTYGIAPDKAGMQAALVVLAGALGSLALGIVVDRAGLRRPGRKFLAISVLSQIAMVTLMFAFGAKHLGIELTQAGQFGLILLGGFVLTCTVGPAAAIVIDVVHPGVRSTGASILSLSQNLFGLAIGPFIGGMLSDAVGLDNAMALTPLACVITAVAFIMARGGYHDDKQRVNAPAPMQAQGAFA
jgi:MFS family permease